MSFANDEEFEAFIGRDAQLPMVTATAVGEALSEMEIAYRSDVKLGWLAMAVRRALAASIRNASDSHSRMSNAAIREELQRLSDQAGNTWAAIFDRSNEADSRLWQHAFQHWKGSNALGAASNPEFAYNRFSAALEQLDWIAGYLRAAAKQTDRQGPNWRRAELRAERIDRARCLAPVFEKAFATAVTANNWSGSEWSGDALAKAPTPFMNFYQKMVGLAFGETGTPDLAAITKEACRLHRRDPYDFEGIIPGM